MTSIVFNNALQNMHQIRRRRTISRKDTRSYDNAEQRPKPFSPPPFLSICHKSQAALENRRNANYRGRKSTEQGAGLANSSRVIIDASARRFQAKKIYLRAVAAIRWSNARNNILQGQRPHQGHTAYLQQITNTLRNVRCPCLPWLHYY